MRRIVCIFLTLLTIAAIIPLAACGGGGIGGKEDEIVGLWTDKNETGFADYITFSSSGELSLRYRGTAFYYPGTWEKQGNTYHIVINMGEVASESTGTIYSDGSSKMLELSYYDGLKLIFERSDE